MKTKILYPLKPKIKSCDDFYVADTETGIAKKTKRGTLIKWQLEATQKKFIFGAVYGRNFTKVFYSLKEMQNEFKDKRYKDRKVFFHNFGKYDSSVLFDSIFDLDKESIFIGSRFISATNGNCTFGDSLNIFKASVKEIGKKLGKAKLGMDEGKYRSSIWPKDQANDVNGCIRDCEIVWDALYEIFEKCGDIKLTIGSLAMQYFRRNHQRFWIESNDNVKHFWHSYYGGRTEAFKIGPTHSHVIDVNSLYPDRMKNTIFPNPKFIKYEISVDTRYFKKLLEEYEGCAQVDVYHPPVVTGPPANSIGVLPYRNGGKLTFPCGNFSGCYNFNELRFAIDHGIKVKRVSWCCHSERMESPFVSFVDTLGLEKFKANAEGRELDEWIAKYLMNNLYGKFGQKIEEKSIYIKNVVDQYDEILDHQKAGTFLRLIAFNHERCDAFLIVKETKKFDIAYSIPSFSSYITSAGRVKMAEKILEMKNNRFTYCDTDSLGFEINLGVQNSMVLGDWKLEKKFITEIRAPKDYDYMYFDEKKQNWVSSTRIKGVPSRAVMIDKNNFEFFTLIGQKEGLRRGLEIGTKMKRTKSLKRLYEKRIVFDNGETEPITI